MSRETWLKERQTGIGSSDAAAIWGASPWMSPLQVYAQKLGLIPPTVETMAMRMGTKLQPIVADEFAAETGRKVELAPQDEIHRHSLQFLICTPDAWMTLPDDKRGILEIKTTSAYNADAWSEKVPDHYAIQVQHQLLVMGMDMASIAVLVGGQELIWKDISRNEEFLKAHIEKCKEFWCRVENKEAPNPDHRDKETLNALFRVDGGTQCRLHPSFVGLDAERIELKRTISEAEKRVEEIDNQIKAAMQDASIAVIPGVCRYSWKLTERKGYTVEPKSYRDFRRLKE